MRREKKTECNHIPISARRDERGTCWPFLPAFPYSTLITVHFTHLVLSLSDATRSFFCLPLLVGSVPPSPSPDKSNNRRVCVSPQSRRRLLEKRNIEFPRALMYGRRDLCPFHSAGATGSFALWAIVWLFSSPFFDFQILHMYISYSKCCITTIRACRFLSSRKCWRTSVVYSFGDWGGNQLKLGGWTPAFEWCNSYSRWLWELEGNR